jgi:hypothetical protein
MDVRPALDRRTPSTKAPSGARDAVPAPLAGVAIPDDSRAEQRVESAT